MDNRNVALVFLAAALKILLIVICVVLILLVLALIIVLLTPLHYKIDAVIPDPEGHKDPDIKRVMSDSSVALEADWLFHLISLKASFQKGRKTAIMRLFFMTKDLLAPGTEEEPPQEEPQEEQKDEIDEKFCDKIRRIKEGCIYYSRLLKAPSSERALTKVFTVLKKVLIRILPSKWLITGTIGLSDPAMTGKVFEILSMMYPYIHMNVSLRPQFELYQFDIKAALKGKFRLGTFATAGLSLILNKDVRKLIRRARRGSQYFRPINSEQKQSTQEQQESAQA